MVCFQCLIVVTCSAHSRIWFLWFPQVTWVVRLGITCHYITLHEDQDHLEQSSHDASNICEDTEHERNPDDPEEEAEQAAAEGAGCKVAVA